MAIVKQRVHKYNGSSYDTIHYETSADVVLYGDTTVAAALDSNISSITGKADAVHAHGSLTSDGKVGTTASRSVYTTTGGAITAGSLAVTDPTASGTATSFINTISESAIGKITATKASLPTASTTTAGITTVGASGGAAAYSHTHGSADISSIDASKLTGTIDIARLPAAALERVVTVADQTARFKLTTATVQLGDVVKQSDTGIMYYVTDESKLNSAAGYTEFTAGAASSVPWSGITDKPTTISGYGITDAAASSHAHGNITNAGAIGSTSGHSVYTTTSGKLTAGSLATTDPTASGTATSFIATASQDAKGKMSLTKASLPTATSSVAGIAKLGASGGAAAYSHNHSATNITSGTLSNERLPIVYSTTAPSGQRSGDYWLEDIS